MNKEQFIATLQACYFGDKGAYNKILSLYDETQQLHSKIDKVIEYIEDESITFLNLAGQRTWCGKHSADKILEILKDSDIK